MRYKRIVEELDRCKTTIETLKQNEKEARQFVRKDYDKLMSENAKLERQKSELVVALRKQFKLIDILKKQKTHLETAKCLSFSEDEFVRIISTYSRVFNSTMLSEPTLKTGLLASDAFGETSAFEPSLTTVNMVSDRKPNLLIRILQYRANYNRFPLSFVR